MERVTVAGDRPQGEGNIDLKELRSRKTPHPVEDSVSHGGHAPTTVYRKEAQ